MRRIASRSASCSVVHAVRSATARVSRPGECFSTFAYLLSLCADIQAGSPCGADNRSDGVVASSPEDAGGGGHVVLPPGSRALTASRRTYAYWCVAVAVSTLVLGVWLAAGVGGATVSRTVSNVSLGIAAFAAAACCFVRARGVRGRVRWAWALIGGSTLSWGLGQLVWTWYESILGDEVPFPSLADVGYLGMIPLTAAGLLMLPVDEQV